MCIRDSSCARAMARIYNVNERHTENICKFACKIFDKMKGTHGLDPVSYTHLDVYKRQAQHSPFPVSQWYFGMCSVFTATDLRGNHTRFPFSAPFTQRSTYILCFILNRFL